MRPFSDVSSSSEGSCSSSDEDESPSMPALTPAPPPPPSKKIARKRLHKTAVLSDSSDSADSDEDNDLYNINNYYKDGLMGKMRNEDLPPKKRRTSHQQQQQRKSIVPHKNSLKAAAEALRNGKTPKVPILSTQPTSLPTIACPANVSHIGGD